MGLFSFFKKEKKKNTANLAKERLQILIAHEHDASTKTPDYLPKLQKELMVVIRKYVKVNDDAVNVKVEKGANFDVLELNITLPEDK